MCLALVLLGYKMATTSVYFCLASVQMITVATENSFVSKESTKIMQRSAIF